MSLWLKDSRCANVLPTAAEFWQRFVDDDGAPSGLQKTLCGAHEDALVRRLLSGPLNRKVDRLRQTSCKSRNAGAWLTALPSLPELVLSDMEFRYAVRHRLGLAPHSNLPARCVCGASLDAAPWHFHCCPKLRPRAITHRHNQLVQLLASLFRHAGALVQVEVKSSGDERIRPDLEIVLHDQRLVVDVSVVHPASDGKRSFTALAAARIIERRKGDKYKDFAAPRDARVLAFVLESYGAFGNEAEEVMKILRACLSQMSMRVPAITAKTMTEMLAICLQKGNAAVSASGSLAVRGTVVPH